MIAWNEQRVEVLVQIHDGAEILVDREERVSPVIIVLLVHEIHDSSLDQAQWMLLRQVQLPVCQGDDSRRDVCP